MHIPRIYKQNEQSGAGSYSILNNIYKNLIHQITSSEIGLEIIEEEVEEARKYLLFRINRNKGQNLDIFTKTLIKGYRKEVCSCQNFL